ncbi:ABC transporter substrate-binding protein [Ornithinimicrobium panacihumi]|uniref:ABC transporter substrate-binding protein n=1 Tax=Ornithinimicrobium panacihumi TaxID=2008449 RepID=UPI003F8936F9
MRNTTSRGWKLAATASIAAISLAACGNGGGDGDGAGGTADGGGDVDCSAYEQYGDLEGKSISVYTSIISPEDQPHIDAFKPFEECTGATVEYEGSREFEAQLLVRLESGNAPDMAYVPQPGLIQRIAADFPDKIFEVGEAASKNIDEYYNEAWRGYGTAEDKLYGAPLGANAKSFVWYSPSAFADAGYEIPTTWDELIALTDQMVADNPDVKPWCAGIESGGATGWPATDWIEDVMLRTAGPEAYDQWVTGDLKFNDPKVVEAIDTAGEILRNEKYVNGGLGDVKSIATVPFGDAGLPILDGACFLHRQASFYQANWPEGTKVAEDGDVFAFYLPGMNADDKPVLGGGEFSIVLADRPEVHALQAYLTSPEWSNEKAKVTNAGWVSANSELDPANLKSPIDQLAYELLTAEDTVFRFDGSDLMPAAVGAGTFWTEMTAWIAEGKDSKAVADAIANSWPAN